MAATSYFAKLDEDASSVSYAYGATPDTMGSTLVIDTSTLRPAAGSEVSVGLLGCLALSEILRKHRDRGAWPERGARYV